MSHTNVQHGINALVTELTEVDPAAAHRLKDLEEARQNNEYSFLANIDMQSAFNLRDIEERAVAFYQKQPSILKWFEWVRNIIIILPIALTWWGLSQASQNYNTLIAKDGDLVKKPFLLLWEQGFKELGNGFEITFSQLALIDCCLLLVIIFLSGFVHYYSDFKEARAWKPAIQLRENLEGVLWSFQVLGAKEKVKQDQTSTILKLNQAVASFEKTSQEFLNMLSAEYSRLEMISVRRDKEFGDLTIFSNGLKDSIGQFSRHGQEIKVTFSGIKGSIDNLNGHMETLGKQHEVLARSLNSVNGHSSSLLDITRQTNQSLSSAISELKSTTFQHDASLKVVGSVSRDLGQMASNLIESDNTLRSALLEIPNANKRVIQEAERSMGVFTDSLKDILSDLQQTMGEVRRVNSTLTSELQNSVMKVDSMSNSYEAVTGKLTETSNKFIKLDESIQNLTKDFSVISQYQTNILQSIDKGIQGVNVSSSQLNQTLPALFSEIKQLPVIIAAQVSASAKAPTEIKPEEKRGFFGRKR